MRKALKKVRILLALISIAMTMSGCASRGKVKDGVYLAPGAVFSCPIPYSKLGHPVEIQDSIEKEKGVVKAGSLRFLSFAGVYRVDYSTTTGPFSRDTMKSMLNMQLDWYRQIPSPKAYVFHEEFDENRLFAILVAPEGQLDMVIDGKPRDLSRTMLIFQQGKYIFAASADTADSIATKSDDKSPERISRLRKQINEFAETIKFPTPAMTNQEK